MQELKRTLPEDISELKAMIADYDSIVKVKEHEIERVLCEFDDYRKKYELLEQNYEYLKKLYFGKKSEKLKYDDEGQGRLFDEAEYIKSKPDIEEKEETIVKEYKRSKAGRKPIPDNIPREEIVLDVSSEEKKCPCCGNERPVIGNETSEQYDIIPAKVRVLKYVRPKYGPCSCDEFFHSDKPEIISAPAIKRVIPGSIASDAFLAYVFTSKFCDALPFYRLSKILERLDVDISRATMSNWAIEFYNNTAEFREIFMNVLKSGEFIRMDETTVQVLHEENREPESKSYMWVAIGYPARGRPLIFYEYHPTRSGEVVMKFLDGFSGYMQTDGYQAYERAALFHGIRHVGCFSHARREFIKANDKKNKSKRAHQILLIIQKLYRIESELRAQSLCDDEFVLRRRKEAGPVLDNLHKYLLETRKIITPSSTLGQAVNYSLNQWDKLVLYLDKACIGPDNNEIERMIRLFVIGRKNWIFSNTPGGARASGWLYSLIQSAIMNEIEPYSYIRYILSRLPQAGNNAEELKKLLPCFLSKDQIKSELK
jgi:transposase